MIVSDSTTLIILFDLNRVELLQNIFSSIFIPKSVHGEINFKKNIELPSFIQVANPKKTEQLSELKMLLDDGESEAIALALELNLPLIIDEKKGRKIAKNLNISIIGLLGVVYLNVKKNHITKSEAKKFIDDAQKNNYRISQKLIDEMFARV